MRNIIIIASLVLGTVLAGGASYLVTSRIREAAAEQQVVEQVSAVDFLLAQATASLEQRRMDDALLSARQAVKESKTLEEKARSGFQVGQLMLDDWRTGGDSPLEAATLYLLAAYDISEEPLQRMEVGMEVLNALDAGEDQEAYSRFLLEMLEQAEEPAEMTVLWKRRLDALLGSNSSWSALNEALMQAQQLVVDSDEWREMVSNIELKALEKVLADDEWFDAYLETLPVEERVGARERILEEIEPRLKRQFEIMNKAHRAEVRVRLAGVYLAMRKFDEAYDMLLRYVDMEPQEMLPEALSLLVNISEMRNARNQIIPLVQSLLKSKGLYELDHVGVLAIVEQLERLGLIDDAIRILEGRLNDVETGQRLELLAYASVLEERDGNRETAMDYVSQMEAAEASEKIGEALSRIIQINMDNGDYAAVELWVQRFLPSLVPGSEHHAQALFAMYDAKFWLGRSVAEQLYIGAVAAQNYPEDPRTPAVELTMAQRIEELGLFPLAISYYNRIGLLNLFNGDFLSASATQNVDEQAVLGKARCLAELGDWVAVNHLYRDLCKRTSSPLVKSEAAVRWAEIALRDDQRIEAKRRYDLAHVQILPEDEQIRFMLGNMRLNENEQPLDGEVFRKSLERLEQLPEEKQRNVTVSFFNETYDFLQENSNDEAISQLIDLACQSPYKDWLPIENYVLRACGENLQVEEVAVLGEELRKMENLTDTTLDDLVQAIDRLDALADEVKQQ